MIPDPPKDYTGKQIAVVGSGPAGLAAAAQLNKVKSTELCATVINTAVCSHVSVTGIIQLKTSHYVNERSSIVGRSSRNRLREE